MYKKRTNSPRDPGTFNGDQQVGRRFPNPDLQVMQNDILRICNRSKLSDRISIEHLHMKSKLLSLEQRREKQLLMLMYIHSKNNNVRKIPGRETRNANKFTFKTALKIGTKYGLVHFTEVRYCGTS